MKKVTCEIALAGNPNCGKTTVFNCLTGARQRVGNWPGVTVERIDGQYDFNGEPVHVTDLPGIYSFSAFSVDEIVTRRHILEASPDLVVNVVDATNLERNLYLTTQLLEMKVPLVVVLNKMDRAKQRGIFIEVDHLAQHLGCPVIPVIATRKKGIDELRDLIADAAAEHHISETRVIYDSELEKAIHVIEPLTESHAREHDVDNRWLAIKLMEHDELAYEIVGDDPDLLEQIKREVARVERHVGDDSDIVVADGRYGFIHGLARDVVKRDHEMRRTVSDMIDKVVLNPILGLGIFLFVMFMVFAITMQVGTPFIHFFDKLFKAVFVDGLATLLHQINTPDLLVTLLADGLGGGIQTVATFIPPIFFLYLCLSFLEDSGYMARAAFVMDRFLRVIGLPGKAFIPMLVGFGCNVPAIMATRTLEDQRDRIMTILINPFMSCGARLPVYILFTAVFFPHHGGIVIFSLYLFGILLAVLSGLMFKRTILKGDAAAFVMELPPYHLPTFGGILFHTWTRLQSFILRAGQVILIVVVILSFLNSIGTDGTFGKQNSADSVLSVASRKLSPVFQPMGISEENWPATVGLCLGIFSKELIIGTLDSLYSNPDREQTEVPFARQIVDAFKAIPEGFSGFFSKLKDPLGLKSLEKSKSIDGLVDEMAIQHGTVSALANRFDGRVGALAYLLFVLIYAPCVAVVAAVYRETNWKWALFSVTYLTGLAWIIATMFYQLMRFGVQPALSSFWLVTCSVVLVLLYFGLHIRGKYMKILG